MELVTSKNKITHVVRVKPNTSPDRFYHYRKYAIAICGTKIGQRPKIKGRKCKKCRKLMKF